MASETRFPAGSYKGMTSHIPVVFMLDMKKNFSDTHQGMLHVQKVPGFEFILIHVGNADENTVCYLLV